MRTEDQIKRKIYELQQAKNKSTHEDRTRVLESQILILEWVLNNPMESYHS